MSKEEDKSDAELESRHRRALDKLERDREKLISKFEATEKLIRKTTKKGVESSRNKLSQRFLEMYTGRVQPDQNLMTFFRGKNDGVSNDDFEPDPTGFEDRYWENEDD